MDGYDELTGGSRGGVPGWRHLLPRGKRPGFFAEFTLSGVQELRTTLPADQSLVTPRLNCPAGESREGPTLSGRCLGFSPTPLGRVGGKKDRSFHG